MSWISQVGLALTRLGNAILGGRAEESLSSRAWRADCNRKAWGRIFRPAIDVIFRVFGKQNHCLHAYKEERNKAPLPVIGE